MTVNGPSSECGKLGRLSCFYLRTIDWWLFFPSTRYSFKKVKGLLCEHPEIKVVLMISFEVVCLMCRFV